MERILEGKRIFLVEDDILNIGIFGTTLSKHGAWVYQDVLGYGILLHITETLPIDLIVMDVMLKRGQNGFEIFEKIKENPQLANIPTVAVTSLDPERYIPRAQEAGMAGFISKPIKAMEFPYQIQRILNGERLWINSR